MKIIRWISCLFLVFNLIIVIEIPRQAKAQTGDKLVFLPVTYNRFNSGPGIVKGNVIDATSGSMLPGATVCYEITCVQTDRNGFYEFTNIPAGAQFLTAKAPEYYPVGRWTNVIAYQDNQLNFVMSQVLSISRVTMRIVTTWSTNPCWPLASDPTCLPPAHENDLDAFLWVTTTGITPTLVWNPDEDVSITQCTSYPNACKENDARQGTGPETIAVQRFTPGSHYYFGVLNYNQYQPDVPPVSQTQASVGVYTDQGLVDTFTVPDAGDGNFWYVFSMDDSGAIHPQNCIIELSPSVETLPDCNLQPTHMNLKLPKKP
jgi:hypothetical protein